MITGKDLIEMGYKPGKWFKLALEHVNKNNLSGSELKKYLDRVSPPPPIEPQEPIDYYKNIDAETDEEKSNKDQVLITMNELLKTPTIKKASIMPDACPTGELGQIPVGGVVVAENAIHPSMHSADICCSVMMSNLDFQDPKKVLDIAEKTTHFGWGLNENKYKLPQWIKEKMLSNRYLDDDKSIELAEKHLCTQGDGNHFFYVGVQKSTGQTCIVTHHGSRGVGAYLYKKGMKVAERFRKQISPKTLKRNAWIPYDTKEGQEYWEALQIIRQWTKFNHELIHNEIIKQLGIIEQRRFWNEHNFVFKDGNKFIHAKGATPLLDKFVPDNYTGLRLIPLNMNQPILIVKGEETKNNLGFAPHGAGRNISRTAHIKKHKDRDIQDVYNEETEGLDARFYCGNIDISELPSAYKNAKAVIKQMEKYNLGEVVDTIEPYGCIMAGDWKIDKPWQK